MGGDGQRMVALLRGVNLGAHNRVPMATLRELVEELGYGEVRTHLQSGNVVFAAMGASAAKAAKAIEAAIERRLGLSIAVLTRTAAELADVVATNPLGSVASNRSRLLVVFLSAPVKQDLVEAVDAEAYAPDRFAAARQEIHVWAPRGVSETKLSHAFWEKHLGVTATGRNWNTVQRLCEMANEGC